MSKFTDIYGLPYQGLVDAPDGAGLGGDLAEAVETELVRIDNKLTTHDSDFGIVAKGTYSPAITATGANPTINGTSFLTGKWWRVATHVSVTVDLYIDDSGDFGGSSWRISLPFAYDDTFHVGNTLANPSDAIGSFNTRHGSTSSDMVVGGVLMDSSGRMIFYGNGSNSSIGSTNGFTGASNARMKIIAHYVASGVDF